MLCNAENGTVAVRGGIMDCAAFGSGSRALVLLPGLGDALETARSTDSRLFLYTGLGRAARAEAQDFRRRVLRFLRSPV